MAGRILGFSRIAISGHTNLGGSQVRNFFSTLYFWASLFWTLPLSHFMNLNSIYQVGALRDFKDIRQLADLSLIFRVNMSKNY